MIAAIAMAVGGFLLAFLLYAGSDFPFFRTLAAFSIVLMVGGCIMQPKGRGGGSDCYTDWDGRSNSVICD